MSKKKDSLTPLQREQVAKQDEIERRKAAFQAAQQYALRVGSTKGVVSSTAPAASSSDEPPPHADFDAIRAALRDARRQDAKRNQGENPRIVSAIDDKATVDDAA